MTRLAGPLGAFISYRAGRTDDEPGTLLIQAAAREPVPAAHAGGVNGALLLRRAIWVTEPGGRHREAAAAALRQAAATALDPSRNRKLLRAAASRRAAAVAKLAARGRVVRTLRVRPAWRLVVGLGEPTPGETGLSLHSTYGVPILPGSALKGLARACAREWYPDGYADYGTAAFGAEPRDNDRPEPGPRAASTGGSPAQQDGESVGNNGEAERTKDGRVMFLDALPEPTPAAGPGVSVDVMNPHTPVYYADGGATPPAEHAQPVPVAFYTVLPSVVFTLHLVGRGDDPDLPELALDDEALVAWLTTGLTEAGLGAKTNSGYGYLTVEIVDGDGAGHSGRGDGR